MSWFILSIFLSFSSPSLDVAETKPDIKCVHDVNCGKGDCWVGVCQDNGYCIAYLTCA